MFNMRNIWKISFFLLLSFNIFLLFWIITLFYSDPDNSNFTSKKNKHYAGTEFTILSTKQNLNELINNYLDNISNNNNIKYTVLIDKNVQLTGSIVAFDTEIPLTATFNPIVQPDGDLILQQESIKLGNLHLPNRNVLKYVADKYPMPDWVQVDPESETIYVAITEMDTNNNFYVKAKEFNLYQNNIAFSITIPQEKLSLEKRLSNFFNK
ncbi:YpmS family protein [Bacillus solimangrovi]|uniref:DUF2140 domain-containing protein n=1 Tax=Bacillus solimangrovi TaxID=1305675 RepID=A0A1E5LFA8_9BACI|nr:YpmS family protein [Bacillus solimangrovi]OEH92761.1 hypothetical protein BFG57_01810 [Bacillus solimangrovi]